MCHFSIIVKRILFSAYRNVFPLLILFHNSYYMEVVIFAFNSVILLFKKRLLLSRKLLDNFVIFRILLILAYIYFERIFFKSLTTISKFKECHFKSFDCTIISLSYHRSYNNWYFYYTFQD